MLSNDKALIVFAKAPVPGQVKTRLMPEYNGFQAAMIHQQLLEYCVINIRHIDGVDLQLHCSPNPQHKFFQYLKAQYRIQLISQSDGDLGQKMSHALFNALLEYKKVVLIGSDAPAIDIQYIENAFDALDDNPTVIGPAEDGGYVLVGLSKPQPMMFEQINWGTEKVLQQTIDQLNPAIPLLLDTLWDVDQAIDVKRFKALSADRYS